MKILNENYHFLEKAYKVFDNKLQKHMIQIFILTFYL